MKNLVSQKILITLIVKIIIITVHTCSSSGSNFIPSTFNGIQEEDSLLLPSNKYLNAPIIKNNTQQQLFDNTLQNVTAKNSSSSNSLSMPPTNVVTKPVILRHLASKTLEPVNVEKNEFFGSIKNMWDEGWKKIDDFFGGKNNIKYGKNIIPFSKKLHLTNVTYDFVIQPPSAWTYCEPYCGVEDQGVDIESVNDTISADILESINEAFRSFLHIEPPNKNNIKVIFEPQNILGQGFGDFYDRKGQKYIISRGTVSGVLTRGQISQQKFTQQLVITFLTRHQMKEIRWENLGYTITEKIKKLQKGFQIAERIKTTIENI